MSSPSMAAAPSSSFTTPIEQKYDVFISFRGADTRNNFLSHLYDALYTAKIKTFIDDDLRRGDDVPKALLRTIEKSKISVVIFSKNYAASKWCLNELVQIMECNEKNSQTVIPVFLKVEPTHVRCQSECFERALTTHEDHPMIPRWKDALTKAANISGWDSQVIRVEATLIKHIVSDILNKLYYTSSSTYDGDGLVGMSSRIRQIENILGTISKEVRIIGFWGMGGIGKSTLAKAFFYHFSSQFEGQYMIQNFREICEKCGLNELLDKLVGGLLNDKNINEGTLNLENGFIRERLHRMRALIVLDDINDFRHIKFLVGRRDCLGQGSVVVITSRDKQILKNVVDEIYKVPELDNHEALCLFARHAFKQEYPRDDHPIELSMRAINYAKGNPLALEILGCHLFGRSNEEQESALSKLERTPKKDIQCVLRISYDELDNEEKNIFLNSACLLKGETIDMVKHFHDSCGYSTNIGICVLADKSLITVNKGIVWMHDLLQEMGKEIVRRECIKEPGKRSRLFDHHDISRVLSKNMGTEAIEGISLNLYGIRGFNISPTAFEMMDNLKFLKIKVGCSAALVLPRGLGYLPNELRYLHWDWYPLTYLPTNFYLKNLVKLQMLYNNVKHLWSGRQNLPHLQVIDLGYSSNLIEIPDLSMTTNLQQLSLPYCCKIKKFPKLSTKIEYLNLSSTGIEEIPSSIYCLTSLIKLNLTSCNRLKNLPESIYKLKSPQLLSLIQPPMDPGVNIHLRELTDSLSCLSTLKQLLLDFNDFLKIPISIELLTNLEYLSISNCKMLQSLPQLPMSVQWIDASNCIALEEVASPLTTATRREFDSVIERDINYDFSNCLKLNQNALNSIEKDVELKLLQGQASCPETFSKVADIQFTGDDIPHWFKYKSMGSSLIAKLPEYWCNSELFCLVFGVVVEVKDLDKYSQPVILSNDFHIRNNIGDYSSDIGARYTWFPQIEDAAQSNFIWLIYGRSLMIDECRMKLKETGDAPVISVDFHIEDGATYNCNIKKCGIHLLYRHEIEDRCRTLRIEFDSLSGTTQLVNPGCIGEAMEETVIGDAEGDGGFNDNCYNMDHLVEFSAAISMETDTNPQPEQPIQKQPQRVNTETLPPVQKVYLRKRKRSGIGPLHGTTR